METIYTTISNFDRDDCEHIYYYYVKLCEI